MKKIIITIFALFFALSLFPAIVTNTSAPFDVGERIGFNKTCHDTFTGYANCIWDFNDGTTITYPDDSDRGWQFHRFKNPGTYRVGYSRNFPSSTPICTAVDNLTITIKENRYISISPSQPTAGDPTQLNAVNFNTPGNIRWDMGDGTIMSSRQARRTKAGVTVTHTFKNPGTYTIRAYDWDADTKTTPVTLTIKIGQPSRRVDYYPTTPRVDQPVYFSAVNFRTQTIDWNWGDGTQEIGSVNQVHRFQVEGGFTVRATDPSSGVSATTSQPITVLPENRFIQTATPEIRVNESLGVTAYNFRGDLVLWNFGDGTVKSGFYNETHIYTRAGVYTITAQDENGESQKKFTAQVTVRGIDDTVNLAIAEITFDNGKYYKVVNKNTKDIRAILKMKLQGTGIISGSWLVDGHPYEFFNELAVQGELKEISTRKVPGLPVLEAGLHTVTVQLTRPAKVPITFPVLKYYVLPYENKVELVTPREGFIAKDKEIPEFSWKEAKGGSHYQVAFSNYLYPLLDRESTIQWIDLRTQTKFTPSPEIWNKIKRNRWTYWQVRALDSNGNVLAESEIQEIKVVITQAKISINRVTDLEGKEIKAAGNRVNSKKSEMIVHGSLEYMGESKFLVLRVYSGDHLIDQLLFRDVKKGEVRSFETSVPHKEKQTRITFQVLKTSSPAVVIGYQGLIISD